SDRCRRRRAALIDPLRHGSAPLIQILNRPNSIGMQPSPIALRALIVCLVALAKDVLAQSWTQTSAPITNWSCVALSADGTKVVAGVIGSYYVAGPIFVSTNSWWHLD